MRLRVGVDGGGTTTRAVVIDDAGRVLGRAQSGSSNLYNGGLDAATANIRHATDQALSAAKCGAAEVASWGFGLAGATGESQKQEWRAALSAIYGERFAVEEDVMAALAGALGAEGMSAGGAILIAGTGANCFGLNGAGAQRRADGWGPLLGDRGSGYWLGESAIRAAVAAFDGATDETALQELLLKYFRVENLHELVSVVYANDFRRDRVAGFVPQVLAAARAGDKVAAQLLQNAGQHLAWTAHSVLQPLEIARLAITGGLLENSPELERTLHDNLRESLGREIEICQPRFEAVVGAAWLPVLNAHD